MVAGIFVVSAVIDVHGFHHGDGLLLGRAKIHELVRTVIITEAEAGAYVVEQIQPLHGPSAVMQTHSDDLVMGEGHGGSSNFFPAKGQYKGC